MPKIPKVPACVQEAAGFSPCARVLWGWLEIEAAQFNSESQTHTGMHSLNGQQALRFGAPPPPPMSSGEGGGRNGVRVFGEGGASPAAVTTTLAGTACLSTALQPLARPPQLRGGVGSPLSRSRFGSRRSDGKRSPHRGEAGTGGEAHALSLGEGSPSVRVC